MVDLAYVCWAAFLAVWGLGALCNAVVAPKAVRTDLNIVGWWPRLLLGVAVLYLITRRGGLIGSYALPTYADPTLSVVGYVLLVTSTLFTLWARWTLGTMWTSVPTIKERHELRTHGPYRVTRHPIYSGILGMLVGTALITGSLVILAGVVAFIATVAARIRAEERLLRDTFGEEYERYSVSVSPLVPFVRWP